MFKIMSRNKYDSLIRENAELKRRNADFESQLNQLENAPKNGHKCGEYCNICENGYEIPSYTIGRVYGCLLNVECEGFVKRKNERS